jgi:hypothetical protein
MSKNKIDLIPLSRIKCVPDRKITAEAAKKLQTSIENRLARGDKPFFVPLIVQKIDDGIHDFQIIDGKCRFQALEKTSHEGLALGGEMPDMVLAQGDPGIIAFAANHIRTNLTLQQEVTTINGLIEEGKTLDAIADELGMSATWVAKRANLNKLTVLWLEVMKNARYPWMTIGHYEAVALFSPEIQEQMINYVSWNHYQLRNLSIKKFEATLNAEFSTLLSKLPWNKDGAEQGCGECPSCKDRNNGGFLFQEMNDPKKARCQNKEYLAGKCRQYIAEQVRENPDLVLIAYEHNNCKIEDAGDALYGVNIVPPGLWTECKPSTKGSKKAIVIDSPQAGSEVNVKVSKPKKSSKPGENSSELTASPEITTGKTKTLAERKEAKHKQRQRHAINKLIAFINAFEYELPNRDAIFALVACKGVNSAVHWHGEDEKEFFTKKYGDSEISCYPKVLEQSNLDKAVWKKLCENIVTELNYGQSGGDVPAKWSEAEIIAELIQFDLAKALEEATAELPDPKSWIQLEKQEAKIKAEAETEAKAA